MTSVRNADVGDHHVAGVRPRPAAAPAAASAPPASRSSRRRCTSPIRFGVSADRPLGRSIETTGIAAARSRRRPPFRAGRASGDLRPVPKMASTMRSHVRDLREVQLPRLLVGDLDDASGRGGPRMSRLSARVALDVGDRSPTTNTDTSTPRCEQRARDDEAVAAVVAAARTARPPAARRDRRSALRCAATTCRPAFSISTIDGMPISSMVWRSASRICAAFRISHLSAAVSPVSSCARRAGTAQNRLRSPYGLSMRPTRRPELVGLARTAAGTPPVSRV